MIHSKNVTKEVIDKAKETGSIEIEFDLYNLSEERKVYLDHAIFLTKALDILNSLENDYLIESYKRSSECTSLSQ